MKLFPIVTNGELVELQFNPENREEEGFVQLMLKPNTALHVAIRSPDYSLASMAQTSFTIQLRPLPTHENVALESPHAWEIAARILHEQYPDAFKSIYDALVTEEISKRVALRIATETSQQKGASNER